jgi:competence protein ComGF
MQQAEVKKQQLQQQMREMMEKFEKIEHAQRTAVGVDESGNVPMADRVAGDY